MQWVTIYITGKEDFREEVASKLEDSDLKYMPGYNGGSTDPELFSDMYWIDEKVSLRDVKEAIGSKLIWKYRLRFYATLEEFIESQNKKQRAGFSAEERALLAEMVASVYREAS
jgi:hypothetical protein